eukprot:TRINITY_DN6204_c0_g1_i1.p1 TRINITY_DN6204_c0_g1~~TRINITY_DN6204_c0_g1_i1.p1  ORF type:complete len:483 (+),score=131.03 TRINITY_DN6204_c0_g1_i1:82-1449(+)
MSTAGRAADVVRQTAYRKQVPRSQIVLAARRSIEQRKEALLHGSVSQANLLQWRKNWQRRYRRRKSAPEIDLLQRYSGMQEQAPAAYLSITQQVQTAIGRVDTRIQPDFLRIWMQTLVRRFRDPDLSLTSTHFHFAQHCTAVVVLNDHPRYTYGRLILNDAELMLYNEHGAFSHFAPREFKAVVDGLTTCLRHFRPRCVFGDPAPKEELPPRDIPDPASGHMMAYADAGLSLTDADALPSPGSGGGAPAWAEHMPERGARPRPEAAVMLAPGRQLHEVDPAARALAALPERPSLAETFTIDQLLRPFVMAVLAPAAHHTLPASFVEQLPESPFWRADGSKLGNQDGSAQSKVLRRFAHNYGDCRQLMTGRTQYPPPPGDLATTQEPQLGSLRIYGKQMHHSDWSADRATYANRPWQPRWNLGWTPQKAAALGRQLQPAPALPPPDSADAAPATAL